LSSYDSRLLIRGSGPAVVLVPGMNGTGELFYRQLPLLERSYRVATYSLRDDAESLEVLAADLAQIVDAVAPVERRAIIVGESFGGAVALTFALSRPEMVSALVILNSFSHSPRNFTLAIAGLTTLPWRTMARSVV
jgi:pimeloyl-ACP methyl ester carboxylesterase